MDVGTNTPAASKPPSDVADRSPMLRENDELKVVVNGVYVESGLPFAKRRVMLKLPPR